MRYGLLQIRYLGLQKVVRDDQRANSCARIAVATGNRLIDGGLQPIIRFQGRWLRGTEFHYPERPENLPSLKPLEN